MIIVTLSGARGVGKTTVQGLICKDEHFERAISFTTRPPRRGEKDGVDYHFISGEAYNDLVRRQLLCEAVTYDNYRYGFSVEGFEPIFKRGHVAVAVCTWGGVLELQANIPRLFPGARIIDFALVAHRGDLEDRIRKRQPNLTYVGVKNYVEKGLLEQVELLANASYRLYSGNGMQDWLASTIIKYIKKLEKEH